MSDTISRNIEDGMLLALADLAKTNPEEVLRRLTDIIGRPGSDARYALLRGAVLMQLGLSEEAITDMRRVVSTTISATFSALDVTVAVFQLGMALLTQGRIDEARDAWLPLNRQPESALFFFKESLLSLSQDDWSGFRRAYARGVAVSDPYPAIAANMRLISDAVDDIVPTEPASQKIDSLTLLLSGYLGDGTFH